MRFVIFINQRVDEAIKASNATPLAMILVAESSSRDIRINLVGSVVSVGTIIFIFIKSSSP